MLLINQKIFRRAKRDTRYCPFKFLLFQTLQEGSLRAHNILENKSKYLNQEFMFINRSLLIDNEFLKLIKIGALTGEVYGQDLTPKVRVTSIGRQAIESPKNYLEQEYPS